jgi:FMN-dependent NADH-azoreductase
MANLLIVETSPRGTQSVSHNMAAQFAANWTDAHPGGSVVRRDLNHTALRFTDAPWLAAYFTPPPAQTDAMQAALALSNELVAEVIAADVIVIATPVYNYNVPAALKAWFDHIVRKGLTLGFDGAGLLTGRRCIVLLASGGVYTAGSPIADRDLATQWLRLILNVLGIGDVTFVAAGGTKVIDLGQETRADYMAPITPLVRSAALASARESA